MQHIPVKRETRQGSTRVDLGWNGTEAKMERMAKEEMAEEVVMVFLDSFFKHQSLTWRLLHSGDCGGFFPLGPHPNSHLGNFGLIWPFPPLAVCQSKLICGENSHIFPFFPFSLFWLEVHIWNQEWVHRPWRGGSSSGSWLAELWRGGYGLCHSLEVSLFEYKTDSCDVSLIKDAEEKLEEEREEAEAVINHLAVRWNHPTIDVSIMTRHKLVSR